MSPVELVDPVLFVAHPGHELLLHGWLMHARPRTCVLTDGSGFDGVSRLGRTEEILRAAGALPGCIFGRFTDRQLYDALLGGDGDLIDSLAIELGSELVARRIDAVVADAAEGFNPVHDLCRLIVGAACALAASAGNRVRHYELPIHEGPHAYDGAEYAVQVHDLDAVALSEKMAAARASADRIPDAAAMLVELGERAFARETFREVRDWTAPGWPQDERPLYERIGEERVSAGRYHDVIRYDDHVRPIVEQLRTLVGATLCAS